MCWSTDRSPPGEPHEESRLNREILGIKQIAMARSADNPLKEAARVTEAAIVEREDGLKKGLTQAQVVMIGLGGAIGTGLFMGSGLAIGYAGPSVLVSYAIAGFVAVVMVFSLSEMAV